MPDPIPPNAYCAALGVPVPHLAMVATRPGVSLLDGVVAALLRHGGPLTLDEVVAALAPLRNEPANVLRVSIQKAWAGRAPVVKDQDGRYALDLGAWQLGAVLRKLGIRRPSEPPPPPEPTIAGPDQALSIEEIHAAFRFGIRQPVSAVRATAAVLDALDRPMTPQEIAEVLHGDRAAHVPPPKPSPPRKAGALVVVADSGRLRINRQSPDLLSMRTVVRKQAVAQLRMDQLDEHRRRVAEEARAHLEAEAADLAAKRSKRPWSGTVTSVQPRIRLTRSFDQRSHSYLGYVLRIRGVLGGEAKEFVVAVGEAAHPKHQFRVGDEVTGEGVAVKDPDLETADLYKVSNVKVGARGPIERSPVPPFTGLPPTLETYRARGHRRLAAATYASECKACLWGCEMATEMIIDQWNPSRRRSRRETWCYGPKGCPLYVAGPTRKVPGRKGMSWTEEDWVDEQATAHRGEGE